MARNLLITRGKPGGRVLWPGTLVDDALEPGITTALAAQGTRLGAADNTTLIAAATIAAGLKLRGQPIEQAEQVMQVAADQVTTDALAAIPAGETGPQGPQGDPGADGADGADGAAGGGFPVRTAKFTAPATSGPQTLLAATATTGIEVVHSLTLTGAYARSLRIEQVSGTIGNVTFSGPNPAGGTHSEVVVASSGYTIKVYGPGTIDVTIPASASGQYRIGTWEWIGLPSGSPAADVDGDGNGMPLQSLWNGVPAVSELYPDVGQILAPSIVGGYGAWIPSRTQQFAWDGSAEAVVAYLGAVS